MPRYDFECPHGHVFEHDCLIARRDETIPCEVEVNQLIIDDDELAPYLADPDLPLPDGWERIRVGGDQTYKVDVGANGTRTEIAARAQKEVMERTIDADDVIVRKVRCMLKATRVEISFSKSNLILDHGMATNRDAAREGRYNPLNPNTRFMAKGRSWRK